MLGKNIIAKNVKTQILLKIYIKLVWPDKIKLNAIGIMWALSLWANKFNTGGSVHID